MKKLVSLILALGLTAAALTGCGNGSTGSGTDSKTEAVTGPITVITREEGSGTRGAFIELFGIEQKDADGKKVDKTITSAESTNSTAVMMTSVEGNKSAIGYVSLGSLDQSKVKALKVDGNEATAENVKSKTYKVARPFNVATKGDPTGLAKDFLAFIMSEEGQKVVEDNGYISEGNTGKYNASGAKGKITVGGSSSVTPVMEKLKEAYLKLNKDATIDVQQFDSTAGMNGAIDGTFDIGMASRELKDTETSKGLKSTVIAMDGIAVVVNKANTLDNITSEQILKIYTGELTTWDEIK